MRFDDLFASISHHLRAHAPQADESGTEITKRLKELLDLTSWKGPDAPPSSSRRGDEPIPFRGKDPQDS